MKYVVIICDGMSDRLGCLPYGQTAMSTADVPQVEALAKQSSVGRVRTCRSGFPPGSDVANMEILGYRSDIFFNGRAPIEACASNIAVPEGKFVTRLNFVTVSPEGRFEDRTMLRFDAGGVTNEEATELLSVVERIDPEIQLYFGSGFHHLILSDSYSDALYPHDIVGERIADGLPTSKKFREFIRRSIEVLEDHPVNRMRLYTGKAPANAVWAWSSGRAMDLPNFHHRTGLNGAMITATDVLRGLAVAAGMQVIPVEGATGTLNTNYKAKGEAAIHALLEDGFDLAYVHIEAGDAAAHNHRPEDKVTVLEEIDRHIIGPIIEAMKGVEFRLLVLPDHYTCSDTGKHSAEPVPFLLYDSTAEMVNSRKFTEDGVVDVPVIEAIDLFEKFISPASSTLKSA